MSNSLADVFEAAQLGGAITNLGRADLSAETYKTSDMAIYQSKRGTIRANVGRWLLAMSVSTSPILLQDVQFDSLRSGSSSIVWIENRRRGRSVSMREARLIALRILDATEQRLVRERVTESEFMQVLWGEDSLPFA